MTVYDRWFLLPAAEIEHTDDEGNVISTFTGPKYSDDDRIDGYSGCVTTPDVVDDFYPALTQTYPDISEWYIVRFYGQDNEGWNAINEIHNYQDTRTLADHADDVAPVLNAHFPDLDKGGEEWANSFWVTI